MTFDVIFNYFNRINFEFKLWKKSREESLPTLTSVCLCRLLPVRSKRWNYHHPSIHPRREKICYINDESVIESNLVCVCVCGDTGRSIVNRTATTRTHKVEKKKKKKRRARRAVVKVFVGYKVVWHCSGNLFPFPFSFFLNSMLMNSSYTRGAKDKERKKERIKESNALLCVLYSFGGRAAPLGVIYLLRWE